MGILKYSSSLIVFEGTSSRGIPKYLDEFSVPFWNISKISGIETETA